jgi:hypothetical protein
MFKNRLLAVELSIKRPPGIGVISGPLLLNGDTRGRKASIAKFKPDGAVFDDDQQRASILMSILHLVLRCCFNSIICFKSMRWRPKARSIRLQIAPDDS